MCNNLTICKKKIKRGLGFFLSQMISFYKPPILCFKLLSPDAADTTNWLDQSDSIKNAPSWWPPCFCMCSLITEPILNRIVPVLVPLTQLDGYRYLAPSAASELKGRRTASFSAEKIILLASSSPKLWGGQCKMERYRKGGGDQQK